MNRKSLVALICLVSIALFSVQVQAWEWSVDNLKLSEVSVSSSGIEFSVKAKGVIAPGCSENTFYVSNTHDEFKLMAAALLMASAQKKKIAVYFDETADICPVMVDAIMLK